MHPESITANIRIFKLRRFACIHVHLPELQSMLAYVHVRLLTFLTWFIPWWALPVKSRALGWFLHHIIRYRRNVVVANLKKALPDKTSIYRQIVRDCYVNLAAVTIETFKGYCSSIQTIREHCSIVNPEMVQDLVDQGRSVVIAANHFGNFEYAALTIPGEVDVPTIGIWKPFKNQRISRFIHRNRVKGGMQLIPQNGAIKQLEQVGASGPHVSFFLADQSPSNADTAHWVPFLGIDTAFIPGVEVVARKLNIPVVYAAMRRISPGHYQIRYHLLTDEPLALPEKEITRRYAAMIEEDIRADPGAWLWTHKRWKKTKPAAL